MLPITRANLHSFCRTCLKEFEKPPGKQKASYDINDTENLSKWLKVTCSTGGVISSDGYPKCLCHNCYMKVRTFYEFYEKASCSVEALSEVLTEITQESMRNNLQLFCRTCLKRLVLNAENTDVHDDNVSGWIYICMGHNVENTNYNEFPKKMCNWCYKKLRNFIEFRGISEQSFEYLENVVGVSSHGADFQKTELIVDKESVENKPSVGEIKFNEPVSEKDELNKSINIECSTDKTGRDNQNYTDCDDQDEFAIESINNKSPGHVFTEKLPIFTKSFSDSEESFAWSDEDGFSDRSDNFEINNIKPAKRKLSNTTKKCEPCPKKRVTPEMVKLRTDQKPANEDDALEGSKSELNLGKQDSLGLKYGKKITCDQCGKKFYKKFLYIAHVKGVHEGLKNPFQCTICQNSFRLYHYLTRHIKEMHANETIEASRDLTGENTEAPIENIVEAHKCIFCCKVFKRKEHLKEHLEAVHLRIRPYRCKYCDKSFSAGKTRRVHEMGHTGEKPYKCNQCNRGFRQSADLKVHMNQHSENKELLCHICNRMKSTKEELAAHIAMHEASQKHQCPKCGRIFKKKCHLADHDQSVHLKLRPFKCSFCELSFALMKTMRTHEKLHMDESPEVCTTCGKKFKQRNQLLKHIKRLHKIESPKKNETNTKK